MIYTIKNKDSYLFHHGVKGMKWGVKKHPYGEARYTKYNKKINTSELSNSGVRRYKKDRKDSAKLTNKAIKSSIKSRDLKRKAIKFYGKKSLTKVNKLLEKSEKYNKKANDYMESRGIIDMSMSQFDAYIHHS